MCLGGVDTHLDLDVFDQDCSAAEKAFRLVWNLFAYIQANGGAITDRNNRGSAAVRRTKDEAPFTWIVGKPVKLSKELRDAARNHGDPKWQIKQRFVVRGHWRNQAVGPQRSERKRMWIEPYWKGPTDRGEAMTRTYIAE